MDFCDERGAAGHPALVMSALLMPFCSVADEVRDMYGIEAGMTARRIRVLVCTALSDPTCGTATVDMNKYVQLCPYACVEEKVATRDTLFSCSRCKECAAQNSGLLE